MHQLLHRYPIISDQINRPALDVLLRRLDQVMQRQIPGDVVELGCYIGTSSLFIRRLLDERGESARRQFHAYDSFAGLPPKSKFDQSAAGIDFQAGELHVSKKQFLAEFHRAKLAAPLVHKAWFHDLQSDDLPKTISFAFLDSDFYDSIIDSLRLVWSRMSTGGSILIDDYQRETLPGVERAVSDFFRGQSVTIHHEQHIAVISVP